MCSVFAEPKYSDKEFTISRSQKRDYSGYLLSTENLFVFRHPDYFHFLMMLCLHYMMWHVEK